MAQRIIKVIKVSVCRFTLGEVNFKLPNLKPILYKIDRLDCFLSKYSEENVNKYFEAHFIYRMSNVLH